MSEWYEVAFDRLYPVVYSHRDDAEATRAAAAFAPMLSGAGVVLDLACGAGRHMVAFGARGLSMVGLDLSSFLLERAAREPVLAGRLVNGDMRSLPFRDRSVGAVINMFTSYGYFADDRENQRVLDEVARVLRSGGHFLMDFMNARRVDAGSLEHTVRQAHGYTIDEDRRLSDDGRHLLKVVRVTRDDEELLAYDERVRLFDPDDLATMFAAAGLELDARFGDYDGKTFDAAVDERVISLCRRPTPSEGGN